MLLGTVMFVGALGVVSPVSALAEYQLQARTLISDANTRNESGLAAGARAREVNVGYKRSGNDQRLRSNTDGWTSPQPIPGANSSVGGSLAALGGQLVFVYKGAANDQRIFWTTFNPL